jgi:hypothetical protein
MGSVPLGLTISTYVVILVLLVLTYLVERGNRIAEGIGALMGVLAIVSSSLSQAHLSALLQFGSDLHLSLLDVLMVLGFYVFPATYLVLYARERFRERKWTWEKFEISLSYYCLV